MYKNLINKTFFIAIIIILAYWFWISPDFKEISAWVAIFLFWMMFLQQWFKNFTGWTLEKILQKSTNKTWKSMLFGFSASSLMQSSSLVAVLTISFLSAELITLVQSLWIILGSNIGTTTWAWLIAGFWMKINIWAYAMPMIVFWLLFLFKKSITMKWVWNILAWLWFLFLWIHYMKTGFESFQWSINLIDFAMTGFLWVFVYVVIGMLATIVMQSSHATIILVIAALATGQVSYENSLALIIWANIGTTITAVIWSLTSNINWKRLALADVMFKSITWIFFIIFIFQITWVVDVIANILWISAENYTLKLAIFHTLFNVTWAIILVPFLPKLIKFITKILPEKQKSKNIYKNKYLNEAVFDFPDTAIISLVKETRHLYNNVCEVFLESIWLKNSDIENNYNKEELKNKIKAIEVKEIDDLYNKKVKFLYSEIINFTTLAQTSNHEKYYNNFNKIKIASRRLAEVIKSDKHLNKNLNIYLNSKNENIKNQYENIIFDLLELFNDVNNLSKSYENEEKLMILAKIEQDKIKKDVINNWTIDNLIRNNLITNEMATSLLNDSYYKNEIFDHLLEVSQIIFNNEISDEITQTKNPKKIKKWFNTSFWMSEKKLEKTIKKLKNKKSNLKQKIKKIDDEQKIKEIKNEIQNIDFIIKKYKD